MISEEDIQNMAALTLERILKSKPPPSRLDSQHFEQYLEHRAQRDCVPPSPHLPQLDVRDKRILVAFESSIFLQSESGRGHFSCELFLE